MLIVRFVQAKRQRSHGLDEPTIDNPEILNSQSDEVLGLRVEAALSTPALERSQATPLTHVLTKIFVWRVYTIIKDLDDESRAGLTKHKALARVLNDMTHGPVSELEDLEWMGDHACTMARDYHRRKIGPAEDALKRKGSAATVAARKDELARLHLQLYTMPSPSSIPTCADRARPFRTPMDVDRDGEILQLKAERAVLRQNPDEAKRERDRADVAMVAAVVAQEEAAASVAVLQAQVDTLAAASAERRVKRAEAKAAAAAQERDKAVAAKHAAKAKEAAAVDCAKQEQAKALKAGAAVVQALVTEGEAVQARLRLEAEFESEVERRVQLEVPQLREELDAIYSEEIAAAGAALKAAEETAAEKKRRKKADAARDKTNKDRLERAKEAEQKVGELEAEIH